METDIAGGCCCIDADGWDFGIVQIRTARKRYKCLECSEPIEPGQRYEYVRGCWEGAFDTHRTCVLCARIRDDLFSCGFYYGELFSQLWDCYGIDLMTGETADC